jgi:hypothetical protein
VWKLDPPWAEKSNLTRVSEDDSFSSLRRNMSSYVAIHTIGRYMKVAGKHKSLVFNPNIEKKL